MYINVAGAQGWCVMQIESFDKQTLICCITRGIFLNASATIIELEVLQQFTSFS